MLPIPDLSFFEITEDQIRLASDEPSGGSALIRNKCLQPALCGFGEKCSTLNIVSIPWLNYSVWIAYKSHVITH